MALQEVKYEKNNISFVSMVPYSVRAGFLDDNTKINRVEYMMGMQLYQRQTQLVKHRVQQ
jgi:hypothetical protein